MTPETPRPEFSVKDYWEQRYARGGNSGAGSYGALAKYKAAFVNEFMNVNGVRSVVDFGCGDGEQISMLSVKTYHGLDISPNAVERCRTRYDGRDGWTFQLIDEFKPKPARYDLAISLDVVYHLIEDEVYESYLKRLFDSAGRYVLIYGSDWDNPGHVPHIRHRWFSGWVARRRPKWRVCARAANPYPFDAYNSINTTFASFTAFEKAG